MKEEIYQINQLLPDANSWMKTSIINTWIELVLQQIERYKPQHNKLLKEATTLLELASWKAKLDEENSKENPLNVKAKKANIDRKTAREERRITSGASIVIKNVLPFLQLA